MNAILLWSMHDERPTWEYLVYDIYLQDEEWKGNAVLLDESVDFNVKPRPYTFPKQFVDEVIMVSDAGF